MDVNTTHPTLRGTPCSSESEKNHIVSLFTKIKLLLSFMFPVFLKLFPSYHCHCFILHVQYQWLNHPEATLSYKGHLSIINDNNNILWRRCYVLRFQNSATWWLQAPLGILRHGTFITQEKL